MQIVQAQDLEALRVQAQRITRFVALLYRGGTRVGQIGKLVQALNAKLFERTWQLVAPAALLAESCLFVMGSEGRGEQLLKTDQDNGLILRDGAARSTRRGGRRPAQRFSAALRDFGYPDCPGGIMVSNPAWRRSASDFAAVVRRWLLRPDPEGLMALAIFIDAHAVAGDAALLAGVRAEVDRLVSPTMRCSAASPRRSTRSPTRTGGWWNRLLLIGDAGRADARPEEGRHLPDRARRAQPGPARACAGHRHGRAARCAGGRPAACRPTWRRDLIDSLHFLMGLKLKAGLAELDAGKPGERRRVDRPAEQPGARPAEGCAGGGQALQGAGAPPVPSRGGLRPAADALVGALRRRWMLYHLADPHFAFMYDPPPPDEWVTLDCETTGLDVRRDQIISVGAVRIVGNRLLTSQRLELLVRPERALKADSVRVHQLREQRRRAGA